MIMLIRVVLALTIVGPLAGCVTGGERPVTSQPSSERDAVVANALNWIELNSQYKNVSPPQHWFALDRQEMRSQVMRRGGDGRATGMYVCQERAVYIPSGIDFKDVRAQAGIVHELTHHAQCVNGQWGRSTCEKEREAYRIEFAFLIFVASLPENSTNASALKAAAGETLKAADLACSLYPGR